MVEILAPAGGLEHAKAAVYGGADAIYPGLKKFSARAGAMNFDEDELRECVEFCHERKVKVYAAVNTIVFDSELDELADTMKFLCEIGIDALIVQDLAVLQIRNKCCPGLEIHASTQMTLHTKFGTKFAKRIGMKRIVLSRELDKGNIAELSKEGIETEVFVHGALCMSVSGQCLMSAAVGGRSANRGACAQPCRLPWSADKACVGTEYALSLKDMSILPELPELAAMGVNSMKIEGRMKRPEYCALSSDCAVKALHGEKYDPELLSKVFSRGGFTDGYYFGKRDASMFGRRTAEDSKTAKETYPEIHDQFRREKKRSELIFAVKVKADEPLIIKAYDENFIEACYTGKIPEPAVNKPCTEEDVISRLSKLGNTYYEAKAIGCDIDEGLNVSAATFNRARRYICEEISRQRRERFSKTIPFEPFPEREHKQRSANSSPKIRINICSAKQLSKLEPNDIEIAFLPLDVSECRKAVEYFPVEKLGVCMPRFTFDESRDIQRLKAIKELGINQVLCTNHAHIIISDHMKLTAHAAHGLNISNSLSLKKFGELGVKSAVVSIEMRSTQINALEAGIPIGVTAYGRLALMLAVNCPISAQVGCKNCTSKLYDRTGRTFPVKCSKAQGYVEILNSDILCISDKLDEFKTADFVQLEFYNESPERVYEITNLLKNKRALNGCKVTRGLYFRGVK